MKKKKRRKNNEHKIKDHIPIIYPKIFIMQQSFSKKLKQMFKPLLSGGVKNSAGLLGETQSMGLPGLSF